MLANYSSTDEKQRAKFYDKLNRNDTTALDAAIAAAQNYGWNEGREHERKCAAAARQPLVELLLEIRELMPDATMKDLKNRIDALAKVKEGK